MYKYNAYLPERFTRETALSLLPINRRIRRLVGPHGRVFLIALDHGLPAGPLAGIERPAAFLDRLGDAPYGGIVVNPGIVRHIVGSLGTERALVVHLSGGTVLGARSTSKVPVGSVERAVTLGADAVSAQICFGDPAEDRMIEDAGRIVDQAAALGVPVVGMAYATDRAAESPNDASPVAHAARATAEIGVSLVQIAYDGPPDGIRSVARGCPVPVLLAGGPARRSEERWLGGLREALRSGIAGVVVGRVLFSAENPAALARRIGEILFEERREPIPVRGILP